MITTFLVEHPWVTTAAFVACLVLGPLAGYRLADSGRWALGWALVSLLPIAALTLVPTSRELTATCAVEWSFPTFGAVELMANVVLFIPPALLFGVAIRRPVPTLLGASILSALIETVQALAPGLGRSCSTNDWLSNTLGAGLGVVLAAMVSAVAARRRTGGRAVG